MACNKEGIRQQTYKKCPNGIVPMVFSVKSGSEPNPQLCAVLSFIAFSRKAIPKESVLVVERRPEEITIETARGMKP